MPDEPRVVVVGTSSCGKTTFARRLASALGIARIELDELYWGPGWQPKTQSEFMRLVAEASDAGAWVAEGNYSAAREVLWPRATTIIWLNFSLPRVLWRGLRRAVSRAFTREVLWHGNRESLRRTFLSRDSILLWIVTTHARRTRDYETLRASNQYPNMRWLEFRHPSQAERWLQEL